MEITCKFPFKDTSGQEVTISNCFLPVDGCIPCVLRGFAAYSGDVYITAKIYADHWTSYLSEADYLVINIPDSIISVTPQEVVPVILTTLNESTVIVCGIEIHKK